MQWKINLILFINKYIQILCNYYKYYYYTILMISFFHIKLNQKYGMLLIKLHKLNRFLKFFIRFISMYLFISQKLRLSYIAYLLANSESCLI